jgi:hypothetical protein
VVGRGVGRTPYGDALSLAAAAVEYWGVIEWRLQGIGLSNPLHLSARRFLVHVDGMCREAMATEELAQDGSQPAGNGNVAPVGGVAAVLAAGGEIG